MGRGRQGDTWGREIKNRKGIAWEEGARGQGDTWGREIKKSFEITSDPYGLSFYFPFRP